MPSRHSEWNSIKTTSAIGGGGDGREGEGALVGNRIAEASGTDGGQQVHSAGMGRQTVLQGCTAERKASRRNTSTQRIEFSYIYFFLIKREVEDGVSVSITESIGNNTL
jgi:hypothetical protein